MPAATSRPIVRVGGPSDREAIQALFREVFGTDRDDESWTWRFEHGPEGPALIHLVEEDGRLVGHMAHVGFRTWIDGAEVLLGHGGDTMTDPSARGRGLMRLLVEGFLATDHPFAVRMNFPTDKAAVLMQRYGGGRHVGRLCQWVRWADGAAALASRGRAPTLAARGLTPALRVPAMAASALAAGQRGIRIGETQACGSDVDEFAADAASWFRCHRVRDSAYLRWRWLDQPGSNWSMLEARDRRDRLRGWVVAGPVPDGAAPGVATGRIVDLLAVDAATTTALLARAARRLEHGGARLVTLDLADPRPWARRACRAAGFWRRGTGPNVVIGRLRPGIPADVESLDAWYLTRGDSDLA